MEKSTELEKETEKRLEMDKAALGRIPVVHQVLSERPDLFIPNFDTSASIFMGKGVLDLKTKRLISVAASAMGGSPYCLRAQMEDAKLAGATEDEILEALQISAYMGMTRVQSVSFRVFAEMFGKEIH